MDNIIYVSLYSEVAKISNFNNYIVILLRKYSE